jgi:hypothetical protein
MKLLVVEKQLLAGGEDEVLPAVHTFEYLVLEFHDPVDCRCTVEPAISRPPRKSNRSYLGPAAETAHCNCNNLGGGAGEGDGRVLRVPLVEPEDTEGPRLVNTNLRAQETAVLP